jgi:hypothetical protein
VLLAVAQQTMRQHFMKGIHIRLVPTFAETRM